MKPALYGIVARRITVLDGEERAQLVRFTNVTNLVDLAPLVQEYATAYGDVEDIRVELDTTPAN